MISRERLEELIEQGATVWHDDYGEIGLDKKNHEILKVKNGSGKHIGWCLYFDYEYDNNVHTTEVDIEELEEDVESAKWHYEMDCQRVEKLILPTWSEVQTMELENDEMIILFTLPQKLWKNCNAERCVRINRIVKKLLVMNENGYWQPFEFSKDGYLSACRLAKKLFLGENLEKGELNG